MFKYLWREIKEINYADNGTIKINPLLYLKYAQEDNRVDMAKYLIEGEFIDLSVDEKVEESAKVLTDEKFIKDLFESLDPYYIRMFFLLLQKLEILMV